MKRYEVEIVKTTVFLLTVEAESEEDVIEKATALYESNPDQIDEECEGVDYIDEFYQVGSSVRVSDIDGEDKDSRVFRVSHYNR